MICEHNTQTHTQIHKHTHIYIYTYVYTGADSGGGGPGVRPPFTQMEGRIRRYAPPLFRRIC